ncbi:MAG: type II toxin-antitoxin system VapC family toxin, partial [Acidobacteria bacterium]|nr:type II toxin-antitoxin system VapC family toxin [Acidobacteriota bacterium]
ALVQRLLDPFRELAVGRSVAERAGRIRRETGIATPDALIAATAIEYDLTLVTRNRRHFEPVKQLRVRDPGPGPGSGDEKTAAGASTPPAAGRRSARPGTRRRRSP